MRYVRVPYGSRKYNVNRRTDFIELTHYIFTLKISIIHNYLLYWSDF